MTISVRPQVQQVLVSTIHLVEREVYKRALGGTQTTTATPGPINAQQTTTSAPSPSSTGTMSGNGGTSSPLLFFVALGFGVVFTNLWIIVGVKYCFRYNARNRAIRNGEDPDPINLENMPARPHRRRREKKLMTMEEVNERFPLTKYKAWMASRASEGLPTAGGVTAPPSRAASLRDAEGAIPPVPSTPYIDATERNAEDAAVGATTTTVVLGEKSGSSEEETHALEQVKTTASTVHKHATATSDDEEEEEDDHIHTAVPPELLTTPGDSCAICIDTLEDDDDIRGLTCGHAFHASCLDPWLTSRRACCPLCKADYFVPKPRPEGEPVVEERAGRRQRMPQQPASAWTGIRGNTRLIIPGRFLGGSANNSAQNASRSTRQSRRTAAAAAAAQPAVGGDANAVQSTGSTPNTSRWAPRNPFANLHMPSLPGRARAGATPAVGTDPSPSQLEAGVVR